MNLMATHRKIDMRTVQRLTGQLMQRDEVLVAILKRVGPQTFSMDELRNPACRVECRSAGEALTFEVVEEVAMVMKRKEET